MGPYSDTTGTFGKRGGSDTDTERTSCEDEGGEQETQQKLTKPEDCGETTGNRERGMEQISSSGPCEVNCLANNNLTSVLAWVFKLGSSNPVRGTLVQPQKTNAD